MRIRNFTAAFVAVMILTPALRADSRYQRSILKTLTFHGGRVEIAHRLGPVTVRTAPGSQVTVRATVRASDPDYGRGIDVKTSEAGGVTIRTEYPEQPHHFRSMNFSFTVELEVTVPQNAPLLLENEFGSCDVEGLRAASEIVNRNGSVTLRDTRGGQRIENSFGSVEVDGAEGNLTINNANGSVKATRVRGALSIVDRFGSITVADVGGDAEIHGGNGSIDARNLRGRATVHNSFGTTHLAEITRDLVFTGNNSRVEAVNVGGGVNITTTFDSVSVTNAGGGVRVSDSNGNVTVTDAKGDLTVDNRFGSVRADRIHGSADIDDANGSVTANDISGNVKIRTTFASAFVKGAGGAIDVQNQNGAISVAGVRSPCHPITLNTTFSGIRIALPPGSGYDVSARTSFGHISSEIPITTNNVGEDMLTGRIGNGGCKLELKTANGGITIGRE